MRSIEPGISIDFTTAGFRSGPSDRPE